MKAVPARPSGLVAVSGDCTPGLVRQCPTCSGVIFAAQAPCLTGGAPQCFLMPTGGPDVLGWGAVYTASLRLWASVPALGPAARSCALSEIRVADLSCCASYCGNHVLLAPPALGFGGLRVQSRGRIGSCRLHTAAPIPPPDRAVARLCQWRCALRPDQFTRAHGDYSALGSPWPVFMRPGIR
ncbi:hypothetical protein NDU88_002522 [Pleurodeles waltl]|uniref:Uncharacterized protein n=1 Tax=Pleurodeles waltl TaxID=8319 RepID=A0AAV7TLW7_PLEWA|nr:hypothetical protein NDU88_002522 [Pleurodeles waltl]